MERCAHDYRDAGLPPQVEALCDYAVKLTRTPAAMSGADVAVLRGHGWDDRAIHDAIQVIAYFNYINRVAEGVGIDPEPEWEVERAPDAEGGRFRDLGGTRGPHTRPPRPIAPKESEWEER